MNVKRPGLWIAISAGGGLLLLLLAASREKPAPVPPPPSFEVDIPTAQEVRAMLGAYGQRVEENERALGDLQRRLEDARQAIERELRTMMDDRADERREADTRRRTAADPPRPGPARLRSLELDPPSRPARALHLPAGSFGEATLMTGAFAPTTGEPLPVLLRLESALVGPRRSRVPIRGAYLVGKAQGDANSARAIVQLDTLSVVAPDGRAIETKVNGWVVDDDGLQGLRGTYVWRAAEIASLAAATGGLSAAADALSARETLVQATPLGGTTTAVTGDAAVFAGTRGLAGAAEKISEIVARRLGEITPAVHVPNGRRVAVAFVTGATLEGLDAGGDEERDPFHELDGEHGKKK